MTTQTEAQRLAFLLKNIMTIEADRQGAAAELLRLEAENAKLTEQRDVLIKALEEVLVRFAPCKEDYVFSKRIALDRAEAAISKVKGETV